MCDATPNPLYPPIPHPYAYTLYGLHIHSNEPMPLLPASPRTPDLTISLNPPVARPNLQDAKVHYTFPYVNQRGEFLIQVYELEADEGQAAGKRYCFHTLLGDGWIDCILAKDGQFVQAFGNARTLETELIPCVLGGVVPSALRLQGVTCLHASAVLIDGAVVAFTGTSETGKSTTMAALLQQGADFFSDDLVPLAINHATTVLAQAHDPATVHAYPGYPRLGLMEDAMIALFGGHANLPLLGHTNKRLYTPVMTQDGTQSWPLNAVYLLSPRGTDPTLAHPRVVALSQQEAVADLMPHTTGRALRTTAGHVDDLARIAQLVRTVPVRRVDRPDDLRQLDNVANAIFNDVRALQAEAPHRKSG